MKPSEQIMRIAKRLVEEEVKRDHPYENWEALETFVSAKMAAGDITPHVVAALLEYLDKQSDEELEALEKISQ